MHLINPYAEAGGAWLKGQLHVHSTNSDGSQSPAEVIADYERLGYDFLALTDHNTVHADADLDAPTSMVVLRGTEYRGRPHGPELGVIGIDEPLPQDLDIPAYHAAAVASGGVVIFHHPNWNFDHWPIEQMLALREATAMEVYNAVIEELAGSAEATDKWDCLLSVGVRIFGVASDDAHHAPQRDRAWVMVSAERNAESILAALRAGQFYASTGVTIRSIRLEGNRLTVESENADEIRFSVTKGCIREIQPGPSAEFEIEEGDVYVRVELLGRGAAKAWTNPIFVDTEASREGVEEHRAWYLRMLEKKADDLLHGWTANA